MGCGRNQLQMKKTQINSQTGLTGKYLNCLNRRYMYRKTKS